MTCSILRFGAAALLAGAALGATTAIAQPYYDADTTVPGVTIYAPRTVGRSEFGAPIQIVRESRIVYTRDLDLNSYWGNRALHHRIQRAARDVCDDLDARYPSGDENGQDCYGDAVRSAHYEVGYAP